jgi:RNA polymerase sigma-70 factor (ECF subfamily)
MKPRKTYEQLILPQQDNLRRFIRRRIRSREDRADLCQEVLLRAREMFPGFEGRAQAGTWLLSIAHHVVVDYFRKKAASPAGAPLPAAREPRTSANFVREVCDARERIEYCLACITTNLPVAQQVAVLLAEIYGVTDKEGARTLRRSVPAFKYLLHEARSKLHRTCCKECVLVSETGVPPEGAPRPDKIVRTGAAPSSSNRRTVAVRDQLLHGILFFDPRRADRLTAGTSRW